MASTHITDAIKRNLADLILNGQINTGKQAIEYIETATGKTDIDDTTLEKAMSNDKNKSVRAFCFKKHNGRADTYDAAVQELQTLCSDAIKTQFDEFVSRELLQQKQYLMT
jgi:hypothetical protein